MCLLYILLDHSSFEALPSFWFVSPVFLWSTLEPFLDQRAMLKMFLIKFILEEFVGEFVK